MSIAIPSRARVAVSAGLIRCFATLFAFQVLLNVLVVAQQRAAATSAYGASALANMLLAGLTYCCVRQVVAGRGPWLGIGYTLGGGAGAVIGLFASRSLGL
jgi:hypothetical protein